MKTKAAPTAPPASAPAAGGKCGPIAKSKSGPRRAIVLVAIHLAILIHVAHWKITGTTVTPVEPSEAMQTLELGYVNAGFVLFAAALLATLIFGRFFCGWACHVVAYQDACGWLLKKIGVRPRAFRSRLLAYVPLIAGLYMFVWPTLKRHVNFAQWTPDGLRRLLDWPTAASWFDAHPKPDYASRFATDDFWATFPGPLMAVTTVLVCGPLIVWFLGNKGFCTYGCPYGGLFGVVDRLAPLRIRVTDACEGCGHCTAVCTSNVKVHEEVRLFKAVVDPQCMKCLDCVSVCPKDALYVGWGAPAVVTKAKPAKPKRTYDLTRGEEAALAVVFAAALFTWRGLYGAIPFLASLGMAALTTYCVRLALTLARGRPPSVQNLLLGSDGRVTRAGLIFGGVLLALFAFVGHSFYVQYQDYVGRWRLRAHNELVDAGRGASPEATAALQESAEHLERAVAAGLVRMPTLEFAVGRSWFKLGEFARATARLGPATAAGGGLPEDRLMLAISRGKSGDLRGAEADLEAYLALRPQDLNARAMLDGLRLQLGRTK